MNLYETTLVLDSQQKAEDIQALITKTETFIKNNGGTVVKSEDWGKKRLAYEINRKQYGNYHHIQFEGPATLPGLLEREYRLEEAALRYLTVKTEAHNIVKQEDKVELKEDVVATAPQATEKPPAAEAASETPAASAPETSAEAAEPETPAEAPLETAAEETVATTETGSDVETGEETSPKQ